ncbi:hypothetical protein SKAU_G00368250 [Synaphobranchus kaupii]|uniref:Uncharacterized protein n=1 Tax=Synaphobranchus kaupii TaxID=118154 RepID=A0A9Q1IFM6_SYNKA|nr:hypothetical protein SKAU_G00368250 [Synaphobranchus kaupii]
MAGLLNSSLTFGWQKTSARALRLGVHCSSGPRGGLPLNPDGCARPPTPACPPSDSLARGEEMSRTQACGPRGSHTERGRGGHR